MGLSSLSLAREAEEDQKQTQLCLASPPAPVICLACETEQHQKQTQLRLASSSTPVLCLARETEQHQKQTQLRLPSPSTIVAPTTTPTTTTTTTTNSVKKTVKLFLFATERQAGPLLRYALSPPVTAETAFAAPSARSKASTPRLFTSLPSAIASIRTREQSYVQLHCQLTIKKKRGASPQFISRIAVQLAPALTHPRHALCSSPPSVARGWLLVCSPMNFAHHTQFAPPPTLLIVLKAALPTFATRSGATANSTRSSPATL